MFKEFAFDPLGYPSLRIAGSKHLFPVHRIYCVGRNYAAHAREMGLDDREQPFFFCKPADAVTQSALVSYPPASSEVHHEVELVVAISGKGRNIKQDSALEHVFGYAVGVDLTRRDLQARAKKKGRPWDVAKAFDESAPVSEIYPVSKTGHPATGRIELTVDGVIRQFGDLGEMIWSVPEVIAELSRFFELMPGDLLFTGTPQGVGPVVPGSVVQCSVRGVARHTFKIITDREP